MVQVAPFGKEVKLSDLLPVAVADVPMNVVNVGRRVTFPAGRSSDPDDTLAALKLARSFGDGSENVNGIMAFHQGIPLHRPRTLGRPEGRRKRGPSSERDRGANRGPPPSETTTYICVKCDLDRTRLTG